MRQKLLTVLVVIILLIPAIPKLAVAAAESGQPVPLLVIPQLDGKPFDLVALKGKVVLVHFWATWCAPCKEEMPVLDSFYRRYHPQGVELIAISIDKSRQLDDVHAVMKAFTFPAAMLNDATTNDFGKPLAIPVTYIIDRQGVVREKLMSDEATLTEGKLEGSVKPLLR